MSERTESPAAETLSARSPRPPLLAGARLEPVIPRSIEEAFRYAQWVCAAGLCPDSYTTDGKPDSPPDPQKVVIGILKSLEVGFPPITGLNTIAIIRKRACIWGDGAMALVQDSRLVDKIEVEWIGAESDGKEPALTDFVDAYACVYRIWRKGQPTPFEGRFSVRDAKRAHLWGNVRRQPWIEHPKRMLFSRARAFALRDGFADCLSGLSIREELEDLPPEPPARTDTAFLDDAPAQIAAPAETPMPGVTAAPEQHRPHEADDRPASDVPAPLFSAQSPTRGALSDPGTSPARQASGSPGSGTLSADIEDVLAVKPLMQFRYRKRTDWGATANALIESIRSWASPAERGPWLAANKRLLDEMQVQAPEHRGRVEQALTEAEY